VTNELNRDKQKVEIISKFCSIKVKEDEEPAYMGSRIQPSEFLMLMVNFSPPPPNTNVISQVTPMPI